MAYRILSLEELEGLKEEFLKYLLVRGLSFEEWEKIKGTDLAHKHIEVFSELVFEKLLLNCSFADIILENRVELYQFNKEQATVLVLENKVLGSFNFLEGDWKELQLDTVNLLQGTKAYSKRREEEIFEILSKEGASISDGSLFKKTALLLVK
ncbi:MAG: hypothetical protein H6579_07795 [Chitinophagales bacterium]|nr:hypothetical protein [Chitinophagales bacterium]